MSASPPHAVRTARASLWLANVLLLLFFGSLAYLFILRELRFFVVPSRSMQPSLLEGDRILTLNENTYHRGDVVVLWDESQKDYIVKRIAGVSGDEVSIESGALFLNGAYASEPYIAEPMEYEFQPIGRIADGQLLLLGDNRNMSDDSSVTHHTYPVDAIVGRVLYIYYPLERRMPLPRFPLENSRGR
jgi:signal peptidase I